MILDVKESSQTSAWQKLQYASKVPIFNKNLSSTEKFELERNYIVHLNFSALTGLNLTLSVNLIYRGATKGMTLTDLK